jgi:hypothetical protein
MSKCYNCLDKNNKPRIIHGIIACNQVRSVGASMMMRLVMHPSRQPF